MDKPKVAIIIPNYNKSAYVSECINSALAQTYENIEIIIVDDCSTDKSDAIIKKTIKKHTNIKYYRLPKNHGVSYARNYGAKKTDAEYLVFLDSDDVYINKDKIKNEIKIIDNKKIAFSQWVPMNVKGVVQPYKTFHTNPLRLFRISKILSANLPLHKQLRGYMIPSSIFKGLKGYNTGLSFFEDFDLQCRLGLIAKFVYTKETGEAYRMGTGGLSVQDIEKATKTLKTIQDKYTCQLNPIQKIMFKYYLNRRKR